MPIGAAHSVRRPLVAWLDVGRPALGHVGVPAVHVGVPNRRGRQLLNTPRTPARFPRRPHPPVPPNGRLSPHTLLLNSYAYSPARKGAPTSASRTPRGTPTWRLNTQSTPTSPATDSAPSTKHPPLVPDTQYRLSPATLERLQSHRPRPRRVSASSFHYSPLVKCVAGRDPAGLPHNIEHCLPRQLRKIFGSSTPSTSSTRDSAFKFVP